MSHPETTHFDVFNGDADGLCALHQLRLAQPMASYLVTGVKRDIALLGRVRAQSGDSATVLDLPLGANQEALQALLGQGVAIEYFDHHHALQLPAHPLLHLTHDPAPDVCTSVLVNRHLQGRFQAWAVVGAFGDNMPATAEGLAASLGLSAANLDLLKTLGECLNYNGYRDSEADLVIPPASLYWLMEPYADPLDFLENEKVCAELAWWRSKDMAQARNVTPTLATSRLTVIQLPDARWARRVVGSYANLLASRAPEKVCAILVKNSRQTLTVSLRTPRGCAVSADQLVHKRGGDGRTRAAGINDLLPEELTPFIQDLSEALASNGK